MLAAITSQEMLDGIDLLKSTRPDVETLSYMLGPHRMLEWAHTIGVSTEDGLKNCVPPVPPLALRGITAASSAPVFLWTGLVDAQNTFEHFSRFRSPANTKVLDFGCGCGRMTRFLGALPNVSVFGTDVNGDLATWCQANLTEVATGLNGVLPPLDYPDAMFDLVYSMSIFTHLPEHNSRLWLAELARVLAPGGIAILTTHGLPALDIIERSERHQEMFKLAPKGVASIKAELGNAGFTYLQHRDAVVKMAKAGEDYGSSFTHESYIRNSWVESGLEVLEFLPGGVRGWQDITILRKP